MRHLEAISPIRMFAVVLAAVFGAEISIMLLVEAMDLPRAPRLFVPFLDAGILVLALWPVLWLLVVRPMRRTLAERREFLSRTLTVQEQERASLARDLHDELGQAQTAMLLGARSIAGAATLEEARRRAEQVAEMAAATIESSRRLARGLSPRVLDDLGLAVAVDRLCEDVASTSGIEVQRSIRLGPARLAPEIEIAAYRVLQEALNNAVKHAEARHLRVLLELSGGELRLEVADDGIGMATGAARGPGSGFGVEGMRQRVSLRNGEFTVRAAPTKGTVVTATIPVRDSGDTA